MIAAGRYKINPRGRFCCITAAYRFKFARFGNTDSNVRKRPFETGRTNGLRSRSIDVSFYVPTLTQVGFSGAKVNKIFETTKVFFKKILK